MKQKSDRGATRWPRRVTRREFMVDLAAVAGLTLGIGGCRPAQQPAASPTVSSPTATGSAPASVPTATDSAPASASTPASPSVSEPLPTAPGRVVQAHHAGVWSGDDLVANALRQMLDASITRLTDQNDARQAWASLFAPHERIAIKVNTLNMGRFYTHVPLVTAITDCLQEAGVPAEQIVVYDRRTDELTGAGFTANQDGPGVRCYGTDGNSTSGWTIMDTDVGLSDILMNCDALINVPFLKQHDWSGISFAMKNHYGTFTKPSSFHGDRIVPGITELNALPPIRERARLIVGDALVIVKGGWREAATGDSIVMSRDPVAHDRVGLQLYNQMLTAEGGNPARATKQADAWLKKGAALGLGVSDMDKIEWVRVSVG